MTNDPMTKDVPHSDIRVSGFGFPPFPLPLARRVRIIRWGLDGPVPSEVSWKEVSDG